MRNKQTICQFLNIRVERDKPFIITHNGKEVYREYHDGSWWRNGYDDRGNHTSHEIYIENVTDFWWRKEFDSNNELIYYVTAFGNIIDNRPKEITLDQIAEKFDVSVEQLKIRK